MTAGLDLTCEAAILADAAELAALRSNVAADLSRAHGTGHWSSLVSEAGQRRALQSSRVVIARQGPAIVGTLRLTTKKPWAIDTVYFTEVRRPVYLMDMAVHLDRQRHGVGRILLVHADHVAREWPADAIRLDAYEGPAGAGPFYARCGYREVGRATYRGVPLIYFERLL